MSQFSGTSPHTQPVVVRIPVVPGNRVVGIDSEESHDYEVIVDRHTIYQIRDITNVDGVTYVDMDIVEQRRNPYEPAI